MNRGLCRHTTTIMLDTVETDPQDNLFEDSKQLYFISPSTAPPNIIDDNSPPSVICEKQTPCTFSCYATSDGPFNYSWTKNGQVPVSDDIKIMNNIIVLTPRDAEDYGVYVCHATNSFGSTTYRITVSLTACRCI